jgi:hypothetical protein
MKSLLWIITQETMVMYSVVKFRFTEVHQVFYVDLPTSALISALKLMVLQFKPRYLRFTSSLASIRSLVSAVSFLGRKDRRCGWWLPWRARAGGTQVSRCFISLSFVPSDPAVFGIFQSALCRHTICTASKSSIQFNFLSVGSAR